MYIIYYYWILNFYFLFYSTEATIAEYRAGFNHCAQEVTKNIIDLPGSETLRSSLMNHLALCCQGNKSSVSSQRLPVDNRAPLSPAGTMWTYPSPPPSPLYGMSPPVSPTLSTGMPQSLSSLQCAQEEKRIEETQSTSRRSSVNRIWRPWVL